MMKQRNSKIKWLVFVGVVLLIAAIVFCIWLPIRNKTKAPASNNDVNTESTKDNAGSINSNNTNSISDNVDTNSAEDYVSKSEAEYLAGNKEEAINTIEEGLAQNPDNELLKSKLDVLKNETFNSSELENPRQ